MENKYTPIKTSSTPLDDDEAPVEVTLDEVTSNNTDTPGEQLEFTFATTEEEDTPKPKEPVNTEEILETPPTVEPKKAKKKDRPSRAKKRIQQLHTEKTTLQQELEKAQQEKLALQKQLQEGNTHNKTAMKAALEANLDSLRKGLKDAMEAGDSDQSVKLNEEMYNTKEQLSRLSVELEDLEATKEQFEAPTPQQQQRQSQQVAPPEKALDWIEDNPTFKTDELFHVSALTVSKQLINEGFDDQSDDFYNELDARLAPRFPEVFGVKEKSVVQYDEDGENSSTSSNDETNNGDENNTSSKKPSSTRTKEQTVSGGSRPSAQSKGKNKRGNDSVVLTPKMVKQAERWGLSLEQVARRVAHNEKNRRNDGYVSIKLK